MIPEYQDFAIEFAPPQGKGWPIRARSPEGESKGTFEIPEEATREELDFEERGAALFRNLMAEDVGRLYQRMLAATRAGSQGLRLVIELDPTDPGMMPVAELPWEILYRPDDHQFLSLDRLQPVVRYLRAPVPPSRAPRPQVLKILAVLPNPPDVPSLLAIPQERSLIERACKGANLEVEFLEEEEASLKGLRARLLQKEPVHVLHFMGHGRADTSAKTGQLLFQTPEGRLDPVDGKKLANCLGGCGPLPLIVLNSCDSGRSTPGSVDPFTNVAAALVLRGFPAVLAMQTKVPDPVAVEFSATFYARLAAGDPVEAAVAEARLAVSQISRYWHWWPVPVLFLRTFKLSSYLSHLVGRWSSWITALLVAALLALLGRQALRPPARPGTVQPVLSIEVPTEGQEVQTVDEVRGRAEDPARHYYLFVEDPQGICWLQSPVPLRPDGLGRWHVEAHFSGDPGQRLEIILIASARPLHGDLFPKPGRYPCQQIPRDATQIERSVRVENREGDGP